MDEPIRLVGTSEPPVAAPGETASFEGFVTENQTRLFGSLCVITGSRYEAEEIAQEAFVPELERWDRERTMHDPNA
jgi:predicted RNA polymerase sigma factor